MAIKMNQTNDSCSIRFGRILSLCVFLLLWYIPLVAQQIIPIRGTVFSADDKEPLTGVSVHVEGALVGAVTDIDGNFVLKTALPARLKFSYVGFQTATIDLQVNNPVKLFMKPDTHSLGEVMVVGYGIQKKKLVTGATVQVKGDDIAKLNTVNALGALQSQSPGVNIVSSSGMPGEGFKVTIRGLGTTGSSEPLYIIDGVTGGDINALNPSDIESIDVLKDAASAAIYGSRAANGVILVTTKQGLKGKPQVSYDGYIGWQNVYRQPDLLNAQEYAKIMSEARYMDGLPDYDYQALVPDWSRIKNNEWSGTNWMDEARNKNALVTNHGINIIGGSDLSTYSLGLSYTEQNGIIGKPVSPKYDRYNVRLNSDHNLIVSGKLNILKVGENLTYSYSERSGIRIGDMWSNDIRNLLHTSPFLPNLDKDGSSYHYAIPWESREPNPIGLMDYVGGQNVSKSHWLQANLYAQLEPVKGLRIKTNFGYKFNANSNRSFVPVYKLSSNNFASESQVTQGASVGTSILWENTLNYNTKIKLHTIDALLGQSIEKNNMGESISGTNFNSIFPDYKHAYLNNTPVVTGRTILAGSPWGNSQLASFFGRINYDYNDKYMATVVARVDGSSNFARGHRWGFFPSISTGWIITEEPWMRPVQGWMDYLKLRASWGQNGNQEIPAFQYLSTISFAGSDYVFGPDKSAIRKGAYPNILANENLTWETSEQLNLGLDAHLFKNRLALIFDYYIKTTVDWLVVAPILDSYGTGAPYINGGDVRNSGVELALNWNDNLGKLKYGASWNMAYNKNEVTRIANSEGIIHGANDVLSNQTTEIYRAQVGYPIGYFYGFSTAGIFQTEEQIRAYHGAKLEGTRPGDVIWVDRNEDGVIDEHDQGMIGNPHPDVTVGLGLTASYKGFDFSATLHGAFGQQIMKSYRSFVDYARQDYTSEIFGRWHGPGTSNRLPRLTTGTSTNWQFVSDLYMEDGDYLRLQNMTIGYDFKSWFKNLPLEQLRVYLAFENLFTITGYSGMDPEVGYGGYESWVMGVDIGSYPSPRTIMVGLNVKF